MINIAFEDVRFKLKKNELKRALKSLIVDENRVLGELNVVFCSDDYLLEINKNYLQHDYYTDIITFDYCEGDFVSGDLFISVDRVKDNANTNKVAFFNELSRVVFHGTLHLCGYKDKKKSEVAEMRMKESEYLLKYALS